MKQILLIICHFIAQSAFAQKFKSGDLLLVSLRCYVCPLMERSTDGPYSHSGIVLKVENRWMVAQSLGKVHLIPVQQFLNQRRVGTEVGHYRPIQKVPDNLKLLQVLTQSFLNLPFDGEYRWDNFDEEGREKLYCSEFVAKFYNQFFRQKLVPAPMDYSYEYETWRTIFHGDPPDGELGNSPNSLVQSGLFRFLDNL